MSLSFLIALLFAHGLDPPNLVEPHRFGMRLSAMLLSVVAITALGRWISVRYVGLLLAGPTNRGQVIDRYFRWLLIHDAISIALFVCTIYAVNWKGAVRQSLKLEGYWPIDDLALIAPYLASQLMSAVCFFAVDEAIRRTSANAPFRDRPPPALSAYLGHQMRQRFGVWLCSSLMMSGMRHLADRWVPEWSQRGWIALGVGLGMASTFLIAAPLLLRFVWLAKPLPEGALRTELLELARRLKFRASNILVWHAGANVSNAMISGVIPQIRYVFLSDSLLEDLTSEEVGAVFGHEVGHVRHGHFLYFFAFVVVGSIAAGLYGNLLQLSISSALSESALEWYDAIVAIVPVELFVVAPPLIFGFGLLSRRCERQADVYGARAASHALELKPRPVEAYAAAYAAKRNGSGLHQPLQMPEAAGSAGQVVDSEATLAASPNSRRRDPPVSPAGANLCIQALERVAVANGMAMNSWDWRHGSIAQRVRFLEKIAADPQLADRYDRSLHLSVLALILAIVVASAVAVVIGLRHFPGSFDLGF